MAEFGKEAGERLRLARERLKLSQREASYLIDVTEKTLGTWEAGTSKPQPRRWDKIEEVYGVTIREILGEPEPRQLDRIEQLLHELVRTLRAPETEQVESGLPPRLPFERTKSQGNHEPRKRRAS